MVLDILSKDSPVSDKSIRSRDSLTGLYSRTYFEQQLIALDKEECVPLSVIIADVNGLRLLNNACGLQEGDELLQRISTALVRTSRKEDIVARWGGDEFAILCPRCSASHIQEVAMRINRACSTAVETRPLRLTISLGYATKTKAAESYAKFIRTAENRMYRQKLMEPTSSHSSVVSTLLHSLRERDYETEEHVQRVKALCLQMGQALGLSEPQLNELALLSALHDIGKIGIPDNVLMKPSPLSEQEWQVMMQHPEIGCRIIGSSPELLPIADAILSHHERWDGTGYPRGLVGTQIPLISRILSIVDAYDAMTHTRPYKKALTPEQAIEEIRQGAGTQFDPRLVATFIETLIAINSEATADVS